MGPFTEHQITNAIEERVGNRLFGKTSARGDDFKDWWPNTGDLPIKFFDAYKAALEAKFGPGARPKKRPAPGAARTLNPQVSNSFFETFDSDAPPDLSVRLLEDGFSAFRASLEHRYVWNWGDWVLGTALIWLPPIFAYPLILAFPHTRALFKDGETVNNQPVKKDVGWVGLLMAPLVTSSLAPILLSIYISAFTYFGVSRETVFGWIAGGVNLITSIIYLITKDEEENPALRGVFLWGMPFVGLAIHAFYVLGRGGNDRRQTQLALGSLIPVIITVAYVLFHLAWHTNQDLGMNGWLKKKPNGEVEGWSNGGFLGGWGLWAGLLVGAWLLLPLALQDRDDTTASDVNFVTGRGHFLRTFDHSSLFFDPELAQNPNAERRNPSLATHFYPTDRRPLLKIWWEGAGPMHVRSERFALRFSTSNAGTNADQFVLAPPAPMTLAEFARFLNRAVKEGANFTNKLKVELVNPDDFDYILPPGELFSDNGDTQTTLVEHDAEAAKFTILTTEKEDPDTVQLFHAPRARLANYVGKKGAVIVDEDPLTRTMGDGQITVAAASAIVVGSAVGAVDTKFRTFFKPGDLIVTAGGQVRIVSAITDDQNLTVNAAFATAEANVPYIRNAAREGQITVAAASANVVGSAVAGVNTKFRTVFKPGDLISTAGGQMRIVNAITDDQNLSVTVAFTTAEANVPYDRHAGGDGQITVALNSANVVGNAVAGVNTKFATFFTRGDLIATAGGQVRIVNAVQDDQNLTVTLPFTAAEANVAYGRPADNRDDDLFIAGTIAPGPAYRVVTGTNFDRIFMAGDVIRVRPVAANAVAEERIVTQVTSPTQLMTDRAFSAAVVAGTPYDRVGRATLEGFRYLPNSTPIGIFSGETLIDRAADLGAVLAMGAVSHLLPSTELQAVGGVPPGDDTRPAVNRVYQVFRNWNLNHRRMNEWRMLMLGDAVSEKRGVPRDPDSLQPGVPAGWTSLTAAGEETANLVGWVPLVAKWLDVARRPGVSSLANESFREGDPTNRKLSEGIAFLFDLPMPA